MIQTDIAVIGAGAAGLMAAIRSAESLDRNPGRVILFDTRAKIGAKILISGGTRCNVTNRQVRPSDYHGGPGHFVRHVLEGFNPEETRGFFEGIGVPLVLEPTGKYFPTTHSGKTVLEALVAELNRRGVVLETGVRVTGLKKVGKEFEIEAHSQDGKRPGLLARRVILATGGLSYPETGSDGGGFRIAESLGHRIVKTAPALTPLISSDEDWKLLSGVALEIGLSFYQDEKKCAEVRGAMLFTHIGFSGPAALDISRHWTCADPDKGRRIEVNFLPEESGESLKKLFLTSVKDHPRKSVKNFLHEECALPERWAWIFLNKIGLDAEGPLKSLTDKKRSLLTQRLLRYPLEVTGVVGYKKAEVTAGGVDLREVSVSTMESKRVPGLYFAGEILDIDGRIGGFNFQWAWSTGTIAGRSAAGSLRA